MSVIEVWSLFQEVRVEGPEVVPAVVRGGGAVLFLGFRQSAFNRQGLFDFVVEEFHENRCGFCGAFRGFGGFRRFVEYNLHVRGHGNHAEVGPLFVQFAEVADLRVRDGELHEGGKGEEPCVVAKAEGRCDRRLCGLCGGLRGIFIGGGIFSVGFQGVGGDDGVRLVEDALENALAEVDAVLHAYERARAEQAVPPGILRLPAGDSFLGGEQVQECFGGDFRFVGDVFKHGFVESRILACDFDEPVEELACIDVLCHVGSVVEQFSHERLGVYAVPEFAAFVGVAFQFRVLQFSPVERADGRHVTLARDHFDFDFRELCAELAEECAHAHDAAAAGARVGFHVWRKFRILAIENFGEVFRHAFGDALVLPYADLREVACARGCLDEKHVGVGEGLLTRFGEFPEGICFGECSKKILVVFVAVAVAAAVAPVMAQVKGLVAGGGLRVLDVRGFRVEQVVAVGVFRMCAEFFVGGLRGCRRGEYCANGENA